jgi:hypothetical protein
MMFLVIKGKGCDQCLFNEEIKFTGGMHACLLSHNAKNAIYFKVRPDSKRKPKDCPLKNKGIQITLEFDE